VKAAATRASFFEAPVGRFLRGTSWIFACPSDGLYVTLLGGRPGEVELGALARSYAVPAAKTSHSVLFDGSRVEEVDARALGMLLDHFHTRAKAFTRSLTQVAVVHGAGVAGAVFAGYPRMIPLPCETRLFADTDEALVWLGALPPVRDAVLTLAGSLASRDVDVVRLGALLDERPALSVDDAARALAIASRTLQRRLREAGTSFRAESDRARRDMAMRRLLRPDDALATIAAAVGFASVQSFTDWFRAQTGEAPGTWRKRRVQRR
jgi:AraC-like DNA-binding protein